MLRREKHENRQEMVTFVFVLVDGRGRTLDKDYFKCGEMRTVSSLGIMTGGRNNPPKIHTQMNREANRQTLLAPQSAITDPMT